MNGALLSALERIEREKGIGKEILFEAIESALVSAARKVIDDPEVSKEDISVEMDRETGEITIFLEDEEITNERFGRIAAQTAKQVIIQKIREAERDVISEKYTKKVGMIISGSVHRFEKGNVIVELDDTEAVLPKMEQIPRERFNQGELVRAYLLRVDMDASGPQIILSRTSEGFVKKLFELEVPEISQGIVEIKELAREAGERTKMAVVSKDEKVDPVGACVGMRGARVRDIVKELHGERIDIVRWYDDIREYVPAAVSPAEISRMAIDRENKKIIVTVPREQLSLLIGKKGRNIRLASKLLDWELVAEAEREKFEIPLSEIKGISKKAYQMLEEGGYTDLETILAAGLEGLESLEGVGGKTAEKIIGICEKVHSDAVQVKMKAEADARAESEKVATEEAEARKKFELSGTVSMQTEDDDDSGEAQEETEDGDDSGEVKEETESKTDEPTESVEEVDREDPSPEAESEQDDDVSEVNAEEGENIEKEAETTEESEGSESEDQEELS